MGHYMIVTSVLMCLTTSIVNSQPYDVKNTSRLTLIVRSTGTPNKKLCADMVTTSVFPLQMKNSKSYHLLNFAQDGYSLPEIKMQTKQWREKSELVACLVNRTAFNTVFYRLDPDLLLVNIRANDPGAYLIDRLMRTGASIVRLSDPDFDYLSKKIPPGANSRWSMLAYQKSVTSTSGLQIVTTLIVQIFGIVALITGCALVVPRQEKLAKQIIMSQNLCGTRCHFYMVLGFFVIQAFILTLVTYYYAKYMVFVAVILFAGLGTLAMMHVGQCLYYSRFEYKFGPYTINLFGLEKEVHLSLMQLVVFQIAIAFNILWFCFRLNPNVGHLLQCVVATCIVQFVLSFAIVLPSLKKLILFFLMIVPLEIVDKIVFPLLGVADGKSIFETLLTQPLGFDGSLLPGSFYIRITYYSGIEHANCSSLELIGLLPITHVIIPGLVCALFMLHDCQQQIRYRRNFCISILGYILGQVAVQLFRSQTGLVHPALLYLVPCTLIPSLLVAALVGGTNEVYRLWTGDFIDEDCDLDELNEKRLSHVSSAAVVNSLFDFESASGNAV